MIFLEETYPFYAETLESSLFLKIRKGAVWLLRAIAFDCTPDDDGIAIVSGSVSIRSLERQFSHNAMHRVIDYLLQALAGARVFGDSPELKRM